PGNALASNALGSGQFRYELSMQRLADSLSNELKHVASMLGLASAEAFFARFAAQNRGMECWGTTIQNLLKARGLVPPTLKREQFEHNYAAVLGKLPSVYQSALFGSLKALKTLGIQGTRNAIETIASRFAGLEWAQFTGMSGRKAAVKLLNTASEVEAE